MLLLKAGHLIPFSAKCSKYINKSKKNLNHHVPDTTVFSQSVTCPATDASLAADPGGREFDPGPVPYFPGD